MKNLNNYNVQELQSNELLNNNGGTILISATTRKIVCEVITGIFNIPTTTFIPS
ncbi:hypothetical protein [Aquimarina sp. Aq78]|uniref:hypothetical protein n=1 Tax=Aquimarina sp. Aq78 TaxID=1191889 RepID=UPI00131C2FA8|nr:hypothetical protein [Aquimarina sp. Aq78]